MEKVDTAWLFNADFEKKLFQGKLDSFESSKLNQEFEFFIHLIEPQKTLFSTKAYSEDYKKFLENLTGEKLKQTNKAKTIKNWCQEGGDVKTLRKLQSKFETARFALKENLWEHKVKFVTKESELREGFLYKRPDGLSGIGHFHYPLHKKQIQKTLTDFGEIANLSDELEDDEATEQAYYEIAEYVRMSALLCFTELGSPPEPNSKPETIH